MLERGPTYAALQPLLERMLHAGPKVRLYSCSVRRQRGRAYERRSSRSRSGSVCDKPPAAAHPNCCCRLQHEHTHASSPSRICRASTNVPPLHYHHAPAATTDVHAGSRIHVYDSQHVLPSSATTTTAGKLQRRDCVQQRCSVRFGRHTSGM